MIIYLSILYIVVNWFFFLLQVINVYATSLVYLVWHRLVSSFVSVQVHGASRGRKTRGWDHRRLGFLPLPPAAFFVVLLLSALVDVFVALA